MSKSGVSVSPECISAYNELKLGKNVKFIIYKLSDDYKEIVVEEKSSEKDWEFFRQKLLNAKSKSRTGAEGKGPRYAVYDFDYELQEGEGKRSKITFISWSPDDAAVFPKMTYASSKEALKHSLTGLASEVQATSDEDIEYESVRKDVTRGKR